MKNKLRILVTGAGALLGQGILRCLQEKRNDFFILTADPDHRSAGHWLGDKAITIPMANQSNYLPELERILKNEKVDVLLIGTDVELPMLSENKLRIEKECGVIVVVSSSQVITIANDKWLTAKFLKDHNFPYPLSVMAREREKVLSEFANTPFPFFAKPVDGARSKGIRVIKDKQELEQVLLNPQNLVIQEYLPEQEGEYTAGCLVFGGKCVAIVVVRRDLRDGNTYRATSVVSGVFDTFLKQVSEALQVEGPCNFQFRIKNGQPVIFEINARFSGTTPLRMIFGFNEVLAVLEHYTNNTSQFTVNISEGTIQRVFSDIFIPNDQLSKLKSEGFLDTPDCKEFSFLLPK